MSHSKPTISEIAKGFAREFIACIHKENIITSADDYILGFHFRHVLDIDAPFIVFQKKSDKGIEGTVFQKDGTTETDDPPTLTKNKRHALHTLNHVLDSLCYDDVPNDKNIAICIRATFEMKKDVSCHFFDVEEKETKNTPNMFDTSLGTIEEEQNKITEHFTNSIYEKYDFKFARLGVIKDVLVEEDKLKYLSCILENVNTDIEASSAMANDLKFYSEFVCGAQKLCRELGIKPSIVAYRSIMAALYQLATYANKEIGYNVVILMIRSHETYSHTLGFTLITKKPLSTENICSCANNIKCSFLSKSVNDYLYHFGTSLNRTKLQYDLLAAKIIEDTQNNKIPIRIKEHQILPAIRLFFDVSKEFCDEQSEGRHLRYGLMLSNAGLMRYWPGSAPLLLKKEYENGDHPCRLDWLPKHTHLLEGPENRCLIIPYLECLVHSHDGIDKLPLESLKVLELTDYQEAFSTWEDAELWSPEHRPYAYFTHRYPWCIGAVVGPHSEIRIFYKGWLVAYRNGKGWNRRVDLLEEIKTRCATTESKIHSVWAKLSSTSKIANILKCLVDLAVQMSDFGRCGGHGGFIVYVPTDNKHVFNDKFVELRKFEPLRNAEQKWLTGQCLLREDGAMDRNVAQLILRASVLDGAIVLYGQRGMVYGFAINPNFPQETQDGTTLGTKKLAAKAFVKAMANEPDYQHAFAITISSDGPIGLYLVPDKKEQIGNILHTVEPILVFERCGEG